jgi:methyltransferase (TIGR00027 family)
MKTDLIKNISDTALWIAAYRAQETSRPDAAFRDPLARRLAGERGAAMVTATPNTATMALAMTARTSAIDRLIHHAIAKGVDTVINLGAGLDTRPYRMDLPTSLRWIEVDFPHLIAYKNEMLAGEKPVCSLRRIPADLSRSAERQTLFQQLGAETQNALVITEGVVVYLTSEQAASLAKSLHAIPSFRYWIMDYRQGSLRNNRYMRKLQKIVKNTPFRFTEKYPLQFFDRLGWTVNENVPMLEEANRLGRKFSLGFPVNILNLLFPKTMREKANKTYGYVMLQRYT